MKPTSDFPDDNDKITPPLTPRHSELCSKPLSLFFRQHWEVFDFLFFTANLAATQDERRLIAARALAKGGSPEYQRHLEIVESNKDATVKRLKNFSAFNSGNATIRLVDNFLCYISELIQVCMKSRPDVLKSAETVKIEEVLRYDSIDDLVEFLIERKINELSYKGAKELNQFCSDRLGMSIWDNADEEGLVIVAIELRNILIHNRSIVNKLFLRRLKGVTCPFRLESGKRFQLDFDELVIIANNMITVARRLDGRAATKFGLARYGYTFKLPSQASNNKNPGSDGAPDGD